MNTIPVKTRFAPSPTGLMHFGNVRTALFNFLYAKRMQGTMLLRIEDTDAQRSEQQFCDSLLADLSWLQIEWQEGPYRQSERQSIYQGYYQKLKDNGNVYPCFCAEEELAVMRKIQLAAKQPPRYDGRCLKLSTSQISEKLAQGIKPTLRFRVPENTAIPFQDLVKGPQLFQSDSIGDFIIQRNDGSASFMFCNAIDDADMGVTHALRGDDHLTNTPRQLMILKALNLPAPHYGHFPMIVGPDHAKLSKRNGSRSIQELRDDGYLPLALLNYLSRLGHQYEKTQFLSIDTLAEDFNLDHVSTSPAHFDGDQLKHWQKETLNRCSTHEIWDLIAPYVANQVSADQQELFAKAVQPNILMPKDAVDWAQRFSAAPLHYSDEAKAQIKEAGSEFFEAAVNLAQAENGLWTDFVKELSAKTGRKGKAIFLPLRAALSGVLHGPELVQILILLGKERVLERLQHAHLQ